MALILVITDAGRAALINAKNDGTNAVRIASVGVSATAVTAAPAATTLPGETKRVATISGGAVAKDVMHLVVRDETMDSYTLRSFALYLDNGVLFGLYGQATPIIEKSAQALLLLAVDVTLQDVAAGQISFGDANFLQPPATTDRPGVVELATEAEAAGGTDRTRAITPYTLRVTYGDVWRASNDGAGSGLDADLLDGQEGSWYADIAARLGFTPLNPRPIPGTIQYLQRGIFRFGSDRDTTAADVGNGLNVTTAETNGGATMTFHRVGFFGINMGLDTDNVFRWGGYSAPSNLMALTMQGGLSLRGNAVWHSGNDGAGSGLDADLLDGLQAADFIRRNSGVRPVEYDSNGGQMFIGTDAGGWDVGYRFRDTQGSTLGAFGATGGGNSLGYLYIGSSLANANALRVYPDRVTWGANAVWHAANDGAGSGLDADLLDGQQGSWYADIPARLGYTPVNPRPAGGTIQYFQRGIFRFGSDRDTTAADVGNGLNVTTAETNGGATMTFHRVGFFGINMGLDTDNVFRWGGYSAPNNLMTLTMQGGLSLLGNTVWHSGNDGSGSGLDADMVDGWHRDDIRRWGNLLDVPGAFPPAAHAHSAADIAGAFPGSLSENGYTVLPNGLILQWVSGALMGAGQETTQLVYFPVAFPNACFGAVASTRDEFFSRAADVMFATIGAPSTEAVTVGRKQFSGTSDDQVASRPFIIALGR